MKFCGQCGSPFGALCPSCGSDNPPEHRFCGQCGAPLGQPGLRDGAWPEPFIAKPAAARAATAGNALPGEMKQVTVLFCDIVGSTSLTERLGAEVMRDLVSSFLTTSLAEVDRYGGTAPQFTGDGFMALFGAPVTQEDHVQRALLAALAIERALGGGTEDARDADKLSLPVRIGIHTGPVVFGPIADKLPADYTAIGDTANVAARLQQAAEPATILMSEATYELAQSYARVEPVGPLVLKGKADPITAYRLLEVSQTRAALRPSTVARTTTFVDRQSDLAILNNFLRQVDKGHRQAVGIVGEPGIGKSRLLSEFRRQLGSERVTWLEGRCVSYGTAIPYLLILDLLRSNCGILETDTPESVIERVRSGLERVGLDPDHDSPVLLHLLGVKHAGATPALSAPEAIKAKTFEIFLPSHHQIESGTAPCPRARGSALGRQNIGGVPRVPRRKHCRGAYSDAGDLSARVPSVVDRQILRRTGADPAAVARRQYSRRPLGVACRADHRTGNGGDHRKGGRQSPLSRGTDPSRRRGEGPSIGPDGAGHDS
jgi:class 3 adenylate cyclase